MGAVVARVPAVVRGHPGPVRGGRRRLHRRDRRVAAGAGAEVVSFEANRGLGAAVRYGLAVGVGMGAVAVAFCDADGEYAPEELDRLVGPILDGDADYVVGSRFAGGRRRCGRTAGPATACSRGGCAGARLGVRGHRQLIH